MKGKYLGIRDKVVEGTLQLDTLGALADKSVTAVSNETA